MEIEIRDHLLHYVGEYEERVVKAANALRNQEMPEATVSLYALYETTGNRIQFETVYFERRKFLNVFALMSIWYHRPEDLEKLEEIIRQICEERCWALPAHVDRKNHENWDVTVELFASETAQALTEIALLLRNNISTEIQELIQENVDRRILKPFFSSQPPYAEWEGCHMNWGAVCAGCIGFITIHDDRLDPMVRNHRISRINQAMQAYIEGFTEDGACAEGLDYWSYGISYYIMYARELSEHTDISANLLFGKKIQNMMQFQQKCYFKHGISISFSDGSPYSRFRIGLTSWIAANYPNIRFPQWKHALQFGQDECNRWAPAYRDYAWVKEYLDRSDTDIYVLQDAQWMIANGHDSSMAVKGGHNKEPHNHNDIGNFIYAYGETEFLLDLGAGEYCRDYFNQNRYNIFCNQSESHNVPIINERGQLAGAHYCCNSFEADGLGEAVISFANAYENGSINGICRHIKYNMKTDQLIIRDVFTLNHRTYKIEENLVTKQKPKVLENKILLESRGRICMIEKPLLQGQFQILEKTHKNHAGEEEMVYVIRWTVFDSRQMVEENRVVTCSILIHPSIAF